MSFVLSTRVVMFQASLHMFTHTDFPRKSGVEIVSNSHKYLHNLQIQSRMPINGHNRSRIHTVVLACYVTVGRLNFRWSHQHSNSWFRVPLGSIIKIFFLTYTSMCLEVEPLL